MLRINPIFVPRYLCPDAPALYMHFYRQIMAERSIGEEAKGKNRRAHKHVCTQNEKDGLKVPSHRLFLLAGRIDQAFLQVLRHLVRTLLTLLFLDLGLVLALGVLVFETLATGRLLRKGIAF